MANLDVSRADILSAWLPKETKSYIPVPNEMMLSMIEKELDNRGYKIQKERYLADKNLRKVTGYLNVGGDDKDMGMMIGFNNSYDKSIKAAIAIGSYVFICQNGMINADAITLKRKHTGGVREDLRQAIIEGVFVMEERYNQAKIERGRMLEIDLSRKTISELVGRMFMNDALITSDQLSLIRKEYEKPTHRYDNVDNTTLWGFYNIITYAFKEKAHPTTWLKQHLDLHQFVEGEFLQTGKIFTMPEFTSEGIMDEMLIN